MSVTNIKAGVESVDLSKSRPIIVKIRRQFIDDPTALVVKSEAADQPNVPDLQTKLQIGGMTICHLIILWWLCRCIDFIPDSEWPKVEVERLLSPLAQDVSNNTKERCNNFDEISTYLMEQDVVSASEIKTKSFDSYQEYASWLQNIEKSQSFAFERFGATVHHSNYSVEHYVCAEDKVHVKQGDAVYNSVRCASAETAACFSGSDQLAGKCPVFVSVKKFSQFGSIFVKYCLRHVEHTETCISPVTITDCVDSCVEKEKPALSAADVDNLWLKRDYFWKQMCLFVPKNLDIKTAVVRKMMEITDLMERSQCSWLHS